MLESIEKQDLFKWKLEILQTQQLASWDEKTTIGVVRASIASKYLHLIQTWVNLNEIWDVALNIKTPNRLP